MPSKSDKDKELSPAEEPTDEAEESADAAQSGVGRVWNAVSRAAGATTSAVGKAADATTSAAGQAAGATASAMGKAADATTSAAGQAAGATASAVSKAADATTSAAGQAAGATASAVGKAADATTSAAGQAAGATASAAGKAADATTSAAGQAAGATASAAGNTLDAVASAPKVAFSKIFPECPVPAFMLPTGPYAEDYVFVFQIEEMLDNLQSGVFVRPKIEIWAARDSGYNLEHFIEELEQDFVRQFNETREELEKANEAQIEKVAMVEAHASEELKAELTGPTLNSAARWAAAGVASSLIPLLGGPQAALLLPLLLLGIGLRPRTKMISLLREYLSVRGERSQSQSELSNELEKLESSMHSKNKTLQRAVKRLEVKVHPRIQEIARLICEAERVEFSASEPESEDIPDVEPHLRHTAYLEQLPQKYVRFLG